MYRQILTWVFLSWGTLVTWQIEAQTLTEKQIALVESFVEESNEELSFDELFQNLMMYMSDPLPLNNADEEDLFDLHILSDIQILDFLTYRRKNGNLISIYELQAIRSFDLETILMILPYVTIESRQGIQLAGGSTEYLVRWDRHLQESRAFQSGKYLGSPGNLYLRYRYRVPRSISINLLAEKDAGEPFFKNGNNEGFDFYSGHLYVENRDGIIQKAVLGDFSVQLGQGLIVYNGFATSKSSLVTMIRRSGPQLKPYQSKGEINFQRGIGLQMGLGANLTAMAFYSSRARDATFAGSDSLAEAEIQSIQVSGLHRTATEIANRSVIRLKTTGARFEYKSGGFKSGIHVVADQLSDNLASDEDLYQQFRHDGRHLVSLGIDYNWQIRNLLLFGEAAKNISGSMATLNGLLAGLGKKTDFAVLYRSFPKDYFTYHSRPFGKSRNPYNEKGIYLAVHHRPITGLSISTYIDLWTHPWLRYRVDSPSRGEEMLWRISYERRRRFLTYLQFKWENKLQNLGSSRIDPIVPVRRRQLRFQFNYMINGDLEWRSRVEYSFYSKDSLSKERGIMLYQDLIYQPTGLPISLKSRIAFFDTPSYDSRIYAFENDVDYSFRIPPYFYEGFRYYLYFKYRGIRNLTVEARYAVLKYSDRSSIGSGNDLITGNTRETISLQVRYAY